MSKEVVVLLQTRINT